MDGKVSNLVGRIRSAAKVSATEAYRIATEMCRDGIRTEAEAEALLEFNAALKDKDLDWDNQFTRAMRDYLLLRTVPEGGLSEHNVSWLNDVIAPDSRVSVSNELDLLLMLQKQAETQPAGFGLFVQTCICHHIIREGQAIRTDVERLRASLMASGAANWISREEALLLLRTHDRLGRASNDPAWCDLFAHALGNHLLARTHPRPESEGLALARERWISTKDAHPGQSIGCLKLGFAHGKWFENISQTAELADRARLQATDATTRAGQGLTEQPGWLRRRLGWDTHVSQAERTLVDFLNAEAPGLVTGLVVATALTGG